LHLKAKLANGYSQYESFNYAYADTCVKGSDFVNVLYKALCAR